MVQTTMPCPSLSLTYQVFSDDLLAFGAAMVAGIGGGAQSSPVADLGAIA